MIFDNTGTIILAAAMVVGCAAQETAPPERAPAPTLTSTSADSGISLGRMIPMANAANSGAYANQMVPAANVVAPDGGEGDAQVCEPKLVNERATLDDSCINRIDGVPYDGKRYNAIGREMPEQKSLCNYMFLPRCRRKY